MKKNACYAVDRSPKLGLGCPPTIVVWVPMAAARSAWTAGVWGNGRAASVAQRQLRPGEDECAICRDEVPATVSLLPCKHTVCIACVETMRAHNIFKVRGVGLCGTCRGRSFGSLSDHHILPTLRRRTRASSARSAGALWTSTQRWAGEKGAACMRGVSSHGMQTSPSLPPDPGRAHCTLPAPRMHAREHHGAGTQLHACMPAPLLSFATAAPTRMCVPSLRQPTRRR